MSRRALLATSLLLSIACSREPGAVVRRAEGPPQRTLTELRTRCPEQVGECRLPASDASSGDVILVTPDGGLQVRVPPGWSPAFVVDTVPSILDSAVTVTWKTASGRISVEREANGLTGPSFMEGPSYSQSHRTCAVAAGKTGAIWRLYDPVRPQRLPTSPQYFGHGEAITSNSVRYRFAIRATTSGQRDSIARWLSDAAIAHDRVPAGVGRQ